MAQDPNERDPRAHDHRAGNPREPDPYDAHPGPPPRPARGFLNGLYIVIGLLVLAIILLATGIIDIAGG